jgi:NADH-quinone oxidoreductase subunit E
MSADARAPASEPATFTFTPEHLELAKKIIAKYPPGRQASAVMPLLDLAQRQSGNWLPRVAMDAVADFLEMPRIRVYEVASFYTMFNRSPVGRHVINVCTTTPCWLRGSDEIVKACEEALGITLGETTDDGAFTLREVECLGACVNAPVVQIGDDYFEDVGREHMIELIEALKRGDKVTGKSMTGRQCSCAASGATTLTAFVAEPATQTDD